MDKNNKKSTSKNINDNNTAESGLRLQKYLADKGIASRRAAEEMISEGRVRVNGKTVQAMGVRIDPMHDKVTVDGQPVRNKVRRRYIMLYKPAGYICSVQDQRGRRTVLDLLPEIAERVYPVGRLDYDTSGLLLLTNDGELTNKLLHPSHNIDKTYLAQVQGHPSQKAMEKLRSGVRLEDGMTAPASAHILRKTAQGALVELRIHEGRNRQVRRMLDAVGYPVLHLRRSKMAFLELGELRPGQWRELNEAEIRKLKQL